MTLSRLLSYVSWVLPDFPVIVTGFGSEGESERVEIPLQESHFSIVSTSKEIIALTLQR